MVKVTVKATLNCPRCNAEPTAAQARTIGGTLTCPTCGKVEAASSWIRPIRIMVDHD